ncbi:hypothetical protein [Embleya sp. NBC_00896]|uniref:hypothetical protein n=1 Tax=Embleya sp. NBC_00896 TaxID=2975961 RepID=UPI003869E0AD|nr:hypothetical protein OG928_31880 [Embleya sp. NBC_00896]
MPSFTRGVVFRERVEVVGDRVFPATYRFDLEGEPMEVDAAKALWALGHSLIPGRTERAMAAVVLVCLDTQPFPLPGEDTAPTDVDAVLAVARRMVAVGAVGHDDERGGYFVPRYHLPAAFRK